MIPVRNIYYMLSYAFRALNSQGYRQMATEDFHNVADLCAAILCKGVSLQVKQGLGRAYLTETEPLSALRGRINIPDSIKTQSLLKRRLVCTYDDFSVNTPLNQIIKSTMVLLLHSQIQPERKKEIRRLLAFFDGIDLPDIQTVDWNIHFNRQNETYRMLISICCLVVKGLLQTNEDGSVKLMDYLDEQRMCRLYEKFILEYYRKEHPELTANASQIPWQLDDGYDEMLPVLQTDIMLTCGERVLIIDAKYYAQTTQQRFDVRTIHSGNLNQIFTYVKNKEAELSGKPHEVSGMLLYAKTDEELVPNHEYRMSGNRITVRTLDLSGEFATIQRQLDQIVERYLGIHQM